MKTKTHLLIAFCLSLSSSLWAQWTEVYTPSFPNSYNRLDCPDNMTCFAAGDATTESVIKTSDGGETWLEMSTGITFGGTGTNILNCIDGDTCYFLRDKMYKTTNGGQNWVELNNYPGGIISFVNAQVAYTIYKDLGSQIKIAKTTDYGTTWVDIPHNLVSSLNGGAGTFAFPSELLGYTMYSDGTETTKRIYKTTDGGSTWTLQYEDSILYSFGGDVQFLNELVGYYCGEKQILKTIDGGENWTEVAHPKQSSSVTLLAMDWIDEKRGYVVGTFQTVMKTTDGGETWIDESPVAGAYWGISVPTMDTAYMASVNIYRNSNAGLAKVIDTEGKEIGKIYPNPAQEDFTVSLSAIAPNTALQLFDVSGKLLRTIPLTASKMQVSRDGLDSGTYLYKICEKNTVLSIGKILFY